MDEQLKNRIQSIVDTNRVVLFMKGNRDVPQCGFSMRSVQVVNALGVEFTTFDVLEDWDIRQGIKDFANWPTIPQLYIDGKLVGGSDIVMEMYQNGELQKLIEDQT